MEGSWKWQPFSLPSLIHQDYQNNIDNAVISLQTFCGTEGAEIMRLNYPAKRVPLALKGYAGTDL